MGEKSDFRLGWEKGLTWGARAEYERGLRDGQRAAWRQAWLARLCMHIVCVEGLVIGAFVLTRLLGA